MKRPYDLLSLTAQEQRMEEIAQLESDLDISIGVMEGSMGKKLVEDEDVEAEIFATDADCRATGSMISEMDLYPSLVPYLWPFGEPPTAPARAMSKVTQKPVKSQMPLCNRVAVSPITTFAHLLVINFRYSSVNIIFR
jgi:hypothetical protein